MDWRLSDDAHEQQLRRLLALGADGVGRRADLLAATRLWSDGTVSIHYAPFRHVNAGARVMLVGLTPGHQQMKFACATAIREMAAGRPLNEVFRAVKVAASFAGSMRSNLVSMLDGIGLATALGLSSADALFGAQRGLLQTTSALRYPVLVGGKNYTGYRPKPLEHAVLRSGIETLLCEELQAVPAALIVPLGVAAQAAVRHVVSRGAVAAERCAFGFPHPSGANGHRAVQSAENQGRLREAVRTWLA